MTYDEDYDRPEPRRSASKVTIKRRRGTRARSQRQTPDITTPQNEREVKQVRTCREKTAFASKRAAKLWLHNNGYASTQKPYRCDCCGGYHNKTKVTKL